MRRVLLGCCCWFAVQVYAAQAPGVDPGMVRVPAGEFIMGSNNTGEAQVGKEFGNAKPWYLDEHPQRKVKTRAYALDQFEVTNAQYREFVRKAQHAPPTVWVESGYILSLKMEKLAPLDVEQLRRLATKVFHLDIDTTKMDKEQLLKAMKDRLALMDKLPVTFVSWFDADAFCRWTGKRLPTEAEWEKPHAGPRVMNFRGAPNGRQARATAAMNPGTTAWRRSVLIRPTSRRSRCTIWRVMYRSGLPTGTNRIRVPTTTAMISAPNTKSFAVPHGGAKATTPSNCFNAARIALT